MTESRIQDWIRYVQERAENVPADEETERLLQTKRSSRKRYVAVRMIQRVLHAPPFNHASNDARREQPPKPRLRPLRLCARRQPPLHEPVRASSAWLQASGRNIAPLTTAEPSLDGVADDEDGITPPDAISPSPVPAATGEQSHHE
jgi:hypothetical protein